MRLRVRPAMTSGEGMGLRVRPAMTRVEDGITQVDKFLPSIDFFERNPFPHSYS